MSGSNYDQIIKKLENLERKLNLLEQSLAAGTHPDDKSNKTLENLERRFNRLEQSLAKGTHPDDKSNKTLENLGRRFNNLLGGQSLELNRVIDKQIEQGQALDTISLVLPLLLPETERTHLINLAEGRTENYKGGHALRSELRRLRSFGLIKMTGKAYVAEMKSDKRFDLAYYVALTDLGKRWATQISILEEKKDLDNELKV